MTPESITYKSSGIDWLGDIPSHWEVRRLKKWVNINTSSLPDTTDPEYMVQYIDIGNVDSEGNILSIQEMKFKGAPVRARRIVQRGDVIISLVRTYLKAIAYIDSDADNIVVSTGFAVLSAKSEVLDKFLGGGPIVLK